MITFQIFTKYDSFTIYKFQYLVCYWCNASGEVPGKLITTTSVMEVCPVCNGTGLIEVIEELEEPEISVKSVTSTGYYQFEDGKAKI